MRKKLMSALVLGMALAAGPALADGHRHGHGRHGHHHAYQYREPVRVVHYERRVVLPPPRVYYSPAPVRYYYGEPHYPGRHHDHDDAFKWLAGAIVLGEIIHHADGHR